MDLPPHSAEPGIHATNPPTLPMIPAFVNPDAGRADGMLDALASDARFDLRPLPPQGLGTALSAVVERARSAQAGTSPGGPAGIRPATRVLVAGGDGTVARAAEVLAETPIELAIVPAGTLNHFARDMGIPADAGGAMDLAARGSSRPIDVGYLNGRLFLNTSSLGPYVDLARYRDRYRPRLGYRLALLASAFLVFVRLRSFGVRLEVGDEMRAYRTPLLFLGVGEREMGLARFGRRAASGARGLHVIVVKGKGRRRLLAMALAAAVRGFWTIARTPRVDSIIVRECRLHPAQAEVAVALDGETLSIDPPLHYRLGAGALRVVVP